MPDDRTIPIPVRRKYLVTGGKSIKNTKAGNGKRPDKGRVSWKAGTGTGKK